MLNWIWNETFHCLNARPLNLYLFIGKLCDSWLDSHGLPVNKSRFHGASAEKMRPNRVICFRLQSFLAGISHQIFMEDWVMWRGFFFFLFFFFLLFFFEVRSLLLYFFSPIQWMNGCWNRPLSWMSPNIKQDTERGRGKKKGWKTAEERTDSRLHHICPAR